jgi:small-conductance mechanosensitive channel
VTRELPPEDREDEEEPPERPAGHVRTTRPGTLVAFALAGLVLGWLFKPLSTWLSGRAALVGWTPVLALFLVAAILAGVAWLTWRDVHRRGTYLEPHKAVNRLVLAKACALAGAFLAGGYFGYALSWWRAAQAPLEQLRLTQSLVAGVAGVLTVAASLALERACRVRGGDDPDLT